MAISEKFRARLSDLTADAVLERQMKKSELPKQMGIDYSSFVNALGYGIVPTPRIAMRIADYFGCSLSYLLGESDDEYFSASKQSATFSLRIRSLCKEKQVTPAQVCKDCNIYRGYLARWLKNDYIPSWEYLELLADYFGVSTDYLLGRTDDKT